MGSSPSAIICFGIQMPDDIKEKFEEWEAGHEEFAAEHLPSCLRIVDWGYDEEPDFFIAAEATYQENDWEQVMVLDPEAFKPSYRHLFKDFEAEPGWVLLALGRS